MENRFYPLTFEPILKERIWGGRKLETVLQKPVQSDITGESWELSDVKGDVSVVANGDLKGKTLTELIEMAPDEILGTRIHMRFGTKFPLLFKFLDAREDLSIQVHPNDELAKKRHNSFGKTEMWYVMQADPGAKLIVGWKEKSSPQRYLDSLRDKSLLSLLNQIPVQAGDVYFLPTGTVHAIGAGLVIAEIQQTSDITYRIYDFDRKDANGKPRELHVEQALEAINYNPTDTKKEYGRDVNRSNVAVDCPYFTTSFIPLEGSMPVKKDGETFTVYMCAEGSFSIECNGVKSDFSKGATVLMPAAITEFELSGTASLLEVYIS